jgi:hypothetical protein
MYRMNSMELTMLVRDRQTQVRWCDVIVYSIHDIAVFSKFNDPVGPQNPEVTAITTTASRYVDEHTNYTQHRFT